MAYTPIKFYSNNVPATGTNTLYTVPANNTLIITNFSVVATGEIGAYNLYFGDNDGAGGWGGMVNFGSGLSNYEQTLYQGMYVVNAGGLININSTTGNASTWIQGNGLIGSGTYEGGTPWKLSRNIIATGDVIGYTVPAGRTLIIKTVVVGNAGPTNTTAVRVGAAPIVPYFSTQNNGDVDQYDGAWIANAGENVTLNIGTAVASGPGVTFYLNGVLY